MPNTVGIRGRVFYEWGPFCYRRVPERSVASHCVMILLAIVTRNAQR